MAVRVEVLGSGSRGNCTFVQGGRTRLLLDAGFSATEIARRLHAIGESPEHLSAVVVTHEHGDHVGGVSVLARRWGIPVACAREVHEAARLAQEGIPEWLPVEAGRSFDIGDVRLDPFLVPHDASLTLGFRLTAEGVRIGYCTDLGHVTMLVRERLRSCHLLVLESNHDLEMLREGPYPWMLKQRVGGRHGHLSNEAAGTLLEDVVDGESQVVALAHLSETNNAPELALSEARSALERAGREACRILVAAQERPTTVALA